MAEDKEMSFGDFVWMVITIPIAVIMAILFVIVELDKIGSKPDGAPYVVDNEVKDISFQPQHEESHCYKGCTTSTIPDRWYILMCEVTDADDCISRRINHAPWKWQRVGQRLSITFQRYGWGSDILKMQLDDTGEIVVL